MERVSMTERPLAGPVAQTPAIRWSGAKPIVTLLSSDESRFSAGKSDGRGWA